MNTTAAQIAQEIKDQYTKEAEKKVAQVDINYKNRYLQGFHDSITYTPIETDDPNNILGFPIVTITILDPAYDELPFGGFSGKYYSRTYKGVEIVTKKKFRK